MPCLMGRCKELLRVCQPSNRTPLVDVVVVVAVAVGVVVVVVAVAVVVVGLWGQD